MKRKQVTEQRNKDLVILEKLITEKRLELSKAGVELGAGKEKNLKKLKNLRHELSQLLTIKQEKQIQEKEVKNKKGEQK